MSITRCFSVLVSLTLFIALYASDGGCASLGDADKNANLFAQTTVPAGFENLSQPQRSLVDIYYGNRYLGSQLVTYTPETIIFSDPARIVRLIGDVSEKSLVIEALSGDVKTNAELVCAKQKQANCGVMTPAISSVIFDESRFRVDIFVNRRFLLTREVDISKYLPPSDGDLAVIQNLSAALSGTRNSDNAANNNDNYTFYGSSVVSQGENNLYGSWDYSKAKHFSVNSLYAQREFEGVSYQAGIITGEGFGLSFTPNQTIGGAHVGSSSRTRLDSGFSGGMPLEVFLTTRGRVEIYKDDRLIVSYFLEAGSQQLDTSTFPSGAYDVEIKILDDQGQLVKSESRFFAKQFELPPQGEWLYFIEAGKVLDRNSGNVLPGETDQLLARAGVSRRLSDTLAASASSAVNKDNGLVEIGLFHMGYRYEISPSVMVNNNNAYGLNVIGRMSLERISINAGHRQLWNNKYNNSTTTTDNPALLGASFRQDNASLTIPLFSGTASYRFSEYAAVNTVTSQSQVTRTHAVGYHVRLYRINNLYIDMDASYSQSMANKIALLVFNFRLRDDHWSWRTTPQSQRTWQDSGNSRSERLRTAASWDSKDLFDSSILVDVGAEAGTGDERYDMQLEAANNWGRGNLSLNHVVADGNTSTNYGANFSSSFMANSNSMAVGGEKIAESAIIVNVKGSDGDVFDVSVDGQRRGYAVSGRSSLVPLAPYRQYTVSISPSGDTETIYDFDEKERTVTLYPGNVVSLEYKVTALKLLFGRLLYNGKPVIGAKIEGGIYSADTDDYGLFQTEVRSDKDVISVVLSDGKVIQLTLPEKRRGGVLKMGTIELSKMKFSVPTLGQASVGENGHLTDALGNK